MGRVQAGAPRIRTYDAGRGAQWQDANQAIPSGVLTELALPSGGRNSLWDLSAFTANPGRFTARVIDEDLVSLATFGFLLLAEFDVRVEWAASAAGYRRVELMLKQDGGADLTLGFSQVAPSPSGTTVQTLHAADYIGRDDAIYLRVQQDSGAALNVLAGGTPQLTVTVPLFSYQDWK